MGRMLLKRKFITRLERRQRIEGVLRKKSWSWHLLSKAMGRSQSSIQGALKVDAAATNDPSLEMLKDCASALGVTVGWLVDRTIRRD